MNATAGHAGIAVAPLARLDLRLTPRPWDFATERRVEIDAFFAEQQKRKTGMWNGRVLLLHDHAIDGVVFRGEFFDTDFAAFYALCQWNFPDPAVKNCFAAGALRTTDGGFILGVMGGHTANAGHIYFPCGTPEPGDVAGARVDLDGSMRREIAEELGLGDDAYMATPGWTAVFAGRRIALIKLLQAHEDAAALQARIGDHLAREAEPELADIRVVRSVADIEPTMPPFVPAYLKHVWSCGHENEKPA